MTNTIYIIVNPREPGVNGDDLARINEYVTSLGYEGISYIDKEALSLLNAREYLLKHGPTKIIGLGPLMEYTLPNGKPRHLLLDTLRYMLKQCDPSKNLTIIDPYMFAKPRYPDPDYEVDFCSLIIPFLRKCDELTLIYSKQNFDSLLHKSVLTNIKNNLSSLKITEKVSNDFHDRCWIVDDKRGFFVGTSLSGIGKRYSITDYLSDEDIAEIVAVASSIP